MKWTEEHTKGVEELLAAMSEDVVGLIEAEAALVFTNMKVVGLGTDLPVKADALTRDQKAQLVQLVLQLRGIMRGT